MPILTARIEPNWRWLRYGGESEGIPVSFSTLPPHSHDYSPDLDNDPTKSEIHLFDDRDCVTPGCPLLRIRLSWSPSRNRTYIAHKLNHVLMDGSTFSMYFDVFTRVANSLPPRAPLIVTDRVGYLLAHTQSVDEKEWEDFSNPFYVRHSFLQFTRLVLKLPRLFLWTGSSVGVHTFTQSELKMLKASITSSSDGNANGPQFSTSDALTAFIWKVVATLQSRYHGRDPGADKETSKLVFQLDVRRVFSPPIPREYFGNCIMNCVVEAAAASLSHDSLLLTAGAIRRRLEWCVFNASKTYFAMQMQVEKDPNFFWSFEAEKLFDNRTLLLSNATKFNLSSVDFGNGPTLVNRPAFTWMVPWFSWFIPSFSSKGDIMAFVTLPHNFSHLFDEEIRKAKMLFLPNTPLTPKL
jgi:hypothetical protein